MPEYKLSVDQPNRPDGDPIEVVPFGVIKNREEEVLVEMDRDQAEFIATGYGVTVKDKGNRNVHAKPVDEAPEIVVIDEEGGEDK